MLKEENFTLHLRNCLEVRKKKEIWQVHIKAACALGELGQQDHRWTLRLKALRERMYGESFVRAAASFSPS